MKSSIKKIIALCVCAFAANSVLSQETQPRQIDLPYGNFGVNYLSDNIAKAQNGLYEKTGFNFFFDYYATLLSNPYGGASQATTYNHIMIYGLTADMQKIFGWKGAKFVVSGAYNAGGNLSDSIGNFFTASEASVATGAMFYEMYLAQTVNLPWNDTFKVRLGRMSMGDTFCSLPAFGYLVSGGIDANPEALFANSPFTASTIATWGITAQYNTIENLSFAAGLYQVPPNINSSGWDGTNFTINSDDGYMMLFQATWSPTLFGKDSGLSGVYQIGGYFYGGYEVQEFNSAGSRGNAYGFYIQGQQTVWVNENNSDNYVAVWAGAQYALVASVQQMTWMAYAGLQFQGFVPYRPNDGIYVSWLGGWFSKDYSDSQPDGASCENVVEVTYVVQLNENVSIQPDFQYIMQPYGNSNIDDAIVIGTQLLVSF